jgi:NitT/TauT family transport system substrate-binding protein
MGLSRKAMEAAAVILVTAVVTAGCGADGGSAEAGGGGSGGGELRPVELALSTDSVFAYGYWMADALGYYEDEGLDVTLQPTGGSGDVAQLLAGRQVPAGMGVAGAMLPAIERGADLYPFFTYAYGEVFDVVVPAGSDITSIADLRGKAIGISALAGGEMPLLRALLIEEGIDPDADVELIAIGEATPNIKLALDQGEVVAYAGAKSVIATFDSVGFEVESITPESLDTLPAEGLLATAESRDDTELLVGLARATAKGQLVTYENTDGAVCVLKEVLPAEFTDEQAGRDSLAGTLPITTAPQGEDGRYQFGYLDVEGWETYVEIYKQSGVLEGDIEMDEYVLDELLEDINDFDYDAVVAEAKDLTTDC